MGARKLRVLDVQVIRHAAEQGETYEWIATVFGICESNVQKIVDRTTWKQVGAPLPDEQVVIEERYDELKFWSEA